MILTTQKPKNIFRDKPYKIGYALSGGGIKGMAHAGAIKAFEELAIKPDIISGVSAGAIVGALYADGKTPEDILEIFDEVEFWKMSKIDKPHTGFFKINKFEDFLKDKLVAKNFEDLKVPLRIVATNLTSGESEVFSSGNLVDAVIASSCIPILFTPKVIGNSMYVDGGVFRNFPVSTIREDCEKLIGVNASPLIAGKFKESIFGVAMRTYHFMFRSNTMYDRELCDILIEPKKVMEFDLFESEKSKEIFQIGYQTAKKTLKNIIKNNDK